MHARPAGLALPFLDEHARIVEAPPHRVWEVLVATLPRVTVGARRYAALVRCDSTAPAGAFPAEGSALVAFRVTRCDEPRELGLAGRHRFADYVLTFRLDPIDDGRSTRLRAETRAVFPGVAGRIYKLAVVGSRGHAVAVRRILALVARRT